MKSSDIKPGVKATTKLNGRDQVVTVIGESLGKGGATQWIVLTPAGNKVYRTARRLRAAPMGDPTVIWDECSHATPADGIDAIEDRAHAKAMSETQGAAAEAIATSILTDDVVTIPWSLDAFNALVQKVGVYTLTSVGFQFDGGDESARNNWTVVVEKNRSAPRRFDTGVEGVCRYCRLGNAICTCP